MAQPVRAMLVKTLGFASIGGSYTNVGSPITNSIRLPLIQNFTDAALMFSFDAVNDHFPVAAGTGFVLDVNANQNLNQSGLFLEIGTTLYVRTIGTPSTGSVYFSGFYARGE